MVAIFVGAVVIAGIYIIFANSQKIFHQEARIAQAQLSARVGLELLKNDVRRAGYMSSPNPDLGRDPLVCHNEGVSDIRLHPVRHIDGIPGQAWDINGGPVTLPYTSHNTNIAPDAVILVGNYTNAQTYLAETIDTTAGRIKLQRIDSRPLPGSDELPDGSTDDDNTDASDEEFERLFPTTAFVRVVNRHGRMSFARITGVTNAASRTVTVAANALQRVDQSIQCGIEGYGEGSEVNVVNAILYRLELDQGPDARDGADPSRPFKKFDLVRWLLDQDLNPIPGTREVVIEHVVDFQLWYRQDDPTGATGSGPNIDLDWQPQLPEDDVIVIGLPAGTTPPPLDGTQNASPENLRSAILKISVRTAEEDPEFPFIARAPGAQLHRYELNPNVEGAAHVRTLVTEVQLPNIAFRNLRH
jgi:hypothetical protein